MADSQASLLAEVRAGANRQLQILAADGLLPIPPADLIPLQVAFVHGAHGADPEVAARAAASLRNLDVRLVAPILGSQANEEVLAYFALEVGQPFLVEAVLRRRDVPRQLLVELARRLTPDLQEVLLVRQDAIVEEPAILDALEDNPQLSVYSQRRVGEYREHLLPQARRPVIAEAVEEMDDEALALAIAQARAIPSEGEVEEKTGLTEGQLRLLPVSARIRLARNANRLLRNVLLRDPNARVALAVMNNSQLAEAEVEQIARNRNVVEDVLQEIARRRDWVSKPAIMRALVQNPKTPAGVGLRLVARLSVRDLKEVSRDRNISDAVRSMAIRLYRIKRQ